MIGRISITDSVADAVTKMCDGNPGSVVAVLTILKGYSAIDPQAMLGGLGMLMMLDDKRIYGSSIYVLFHDKCCCDLRKFILLMRANQLGILPDIKIREMTSERIPEVNLSDEEWEEIDQKVCDQLDDFARPEEAA